MFVKRGAQYSVYPLPGKRVLKVPNTTRQAASLWREWEPADSNKAVQHDKAVRLVREGKEATEAMRILCDAHPGIRTYLGRPIFYRRGMYSQRRVELLHSVLARQSHEENVRLLELYTDTLLTEWQYGFADSVFNFTLNTGFMSNGDLALIDFGEVTFDRGEVEKLISDRRWLESWSYKTGMTEDLKSTYRNLMRRKMTLDNLNRHWRTLV